MKFEATMHKNAVQKIAGPIKLAINLSEKEDNNRIPLYFCYFQDKRQIRIIILLSKTPIVLALNEKMMRKVVAKSGSSEEGQFQLLIKVENGLAFLQSISSFIDSEDEELTIRLQKKDEERVIVLQGTKQQRCLRIEKPLKQGSPQAEQLFNHKWFGGIKSPKLSFSFHTQDLINFLHMATKSKKYEDFFTSSERPWIDFRLHFTDFSEFDTNLKQNYIMVYADDAQVPHYIKTFIKLNQPADDRLPRDLQFLITRENIRPLHEIFENGQCTLIINDSGQMAIASNNQDAFHCQVSIGNYIQKRKRSTQQTKMEQ